MSNNQSQHNPHGQIEGMAYSSTSHNTTTTGQGHQVTLI